MEINKIGIYMSTEIKIIMVQWTVKPDQLKKKSIPLKTVIWRLIQKVEDMQFPWWSNGKDSVLPMQGA